MAHTGDTQFSDSACARASTSGRGRGWGCGVVYELALTLYRPWNIARSMRWRMEGSVTRSSMATGRHSYAIAFTMELGRWYLCTLAVYSDAHRTLTGRWSRCACTYPSRRRWKRGKRASVRGTSVRPRLRHIVCLERVPIIPLTSGVVQAWVAQNVTFIA